MTVPEGIGDEGIAARPQAAGNPVQTAHSATTAGRGSDPPPLSVGEWGAWGYFLKK